MEKVHTQLLMKMKMFNKSNCSTEMEASINALSNELKNIRTGRVSPDILKNIVVDSYGTKTNYSTFKYQQS